MKRFFYLVVPMLLSSSAYAGHSLSFTVAGHRIHIESPMHCRSVSCLSVSIPGIYETRRWRDRYDDRDDAATVKSVAAAPASTPQPVVSQSVAPAPPPATVTLASATTRVVAPPAPIEQPKTAPAPVSITPAPPPTTGSIIVMPAPPPIATPPAAPPIATPAVAAPSAPVAAPQVLKVSRDRDDAPAATPLGDWQTEGKKGSVRIEPCGHALCGYIIEPSSNAAGETLLVNMKPKASDKTDSEQADSEWSGNIFSRESGNSYYATMTIKSPNALRVEACALGKFFCSGNVWTRIVAQPEKLISSQQVSPPPRT
jgi:uncharacterized protein (DUF2147 family)